MFESMPGIVIVSVLAGAIGGFAASIGFGTPGIAEQQDQPMPQVLRAQRFDRRAGPDAGEDSIFSRWSTVHPTP